MDGLVGIIQMVIDVICFIPRFIDFFKSLKDFIKLIPHEIAILYESMDDLWVSITNFLINGVSEVYELAKNPLNLINLISKIEDTVDLAAETVGSKAARGIIGFLGQPSNVLGEIAGRISGQAIFELVLAALTSGGGAGLTAAKAALKPIGMMIRKIGRFIFRIIRGIGKALRFLREALGSVMKYLTKTLKLVVDRVRLVIDKILDTFQVFGKYCRPGSVTCRLPQERPKRGFWKGNRGNGVWHSKNPTVQRIVPEGIRYKDGFPIFPKRIIRGRVRLDKFVTRDIDMREASRRLGERMLKEPDLARQVGLPSGNARRYFERADIFDQYGNVNGDRLHAWLKSRGNVWHHHQKGKEMQLIPKIVHRDATHTGGHALSK